MERIENQENSEEESYSKEKKGKQKKKRKLKDKKNNNSISESDENSQEANEKEKREQKIKQDLIQDNFVLLTEIGKGAFGQIYLSYSTRDNEEVATKKEIRKSKVTTPQLKMEFAVMKTLLHIQQNNQITSVGVGNPQEFNIDFSGAQSIPQEDVLGVPKLYGYGENMDYYYLIMQLLGPNLNELFNYCNTKKFTVGTICMIALQMINRIEYMHKHHYIHRDIKPENFLIGCEDKSNIIYLIDYGLSKKYKDPKTNQHIPYRENRCLTGTARYVSINTHLGIEQSRRDDLESIGYVLIFFLKGSLPWQGLKNNKDKYAKIMEKKLQIPTEILCFGLPYEITYYLNYCKSLRFEDRPDYDYLRGLFVKLLYGCISQYMLTKDQLKFDWCFEDLNSLWSIYNKKNKKEKKDEETLNPKEMVISGLSNITPISENNNLNVEMNEEVLEIKEHNRKITEVENSVNSEKIENAMRTDKEDSDGEITIKLTEEKPIDNKLIEKELQEMIDNEQKEDIDYLLEKIDNNFTKSKLMRVNTKVKNEEMEQSSKNNTNSDTIKKSQDVDINKLKDIILEIGDDSEESIINFINDTKKLQNINTLNNQSVKNKKLQLEIEKKSKKDVDFKRHFSNIIINSNLKAEENPSKYMKTYTMKEVNVNKDKINIEKNDNKKENLIEFKVPEEKKEEKNPQEKDDSIRFCSNKELFDNEKNEDIPKENLDINTKENFENKLINRMNTSEIKEKRKNKILNYSPITKQTSNIKLSKDQIIKISSEPIQKYYNIISDLGNGSYGMVKKVKHKHMGEERAMKIVRKKLDSHNEIEILKKISHPNIISIYEIFEDSKNYYIMTELLEGGELFEEITRHGFFTEKEAASVIKQLLNGVVYMHNKFIVHRDLKPENIMLINKTNSECSKFDIKIIDFGTAKIFEKGMKLSKFIGTSYYIAPEVLSENYDEKCDIWSCGVILYILLCGYPPFNGATNLDIYHSIKYSPPNFTGDEWKEVSREAIDLIKIMLNKPPHKRYSAEQCLLHKWFEISLLNESINNDKNGDIKKPQTKQLKALNKMSDFVMENRLKQSVLQFISTQFNLKEEEKNLRSLFQQFDTEKKGFITYGSFYTVLTKYFGENESKIISDKMFESLDLDGSGEISYNEFITSIIDNKTLVTNERLEKTFKMFDKDNSGRISVDEIKGVFGGDKEKWRKIIREIDLDGDGEIDLIEFKGMMGVIEENELK